MSFPTDTGNFYSLFYVLILEFIYLKICDEIKTLCLHLSHLNLRVMDVSGIFYCTAQQRNTTVQLKLLFKYKSNP